ncbi:histidine kinase [Leptospira yanagawae serovar Saopaulo str. Sao Paulo = ATCC 700523]|uniref:Histidine kinase n=2 Tax=Leptospira yanagawae TaxID=293069 RepID=A0ABY2M0U3_9LEPT|nr:histidine kinase [Leptospira yanagawae]EOQ90200.1 histidine kinase [Leptospira yanagawae serovar Saopaulo str. Sao Paulo = ATCC 700523]TGL17494.1 histidine kinase [Leptospira yanagawae]
MGVAISRFLEKPYLSICLLFLITVVSITSYVYSIFKPKDSSISEYYLSENAEYFVGDIPKDDTGKIDFQKMHKVHWLSSSGWINDDEFKRITDSEYIWLRSKAFSEVENEDLHFLLEHAGLNIEIFNENGDTIFKYGEFSDPKYLPNIFQSKFSWVKIPNDGSKFYYLRLFHKKGILFSITIIENLIGKQTALYREIALKNVTAIFFHSFFLMIGIICAFVYFIEYKKQYNILLDFSSFSLCFGILGLTSNEFIRYLFTNTQTLYILSIIASNFVFIPMLSGVRRLFGSGSFRVLDILIYGDVVICSLTTILVFSLPFSDISHSLLISTRSFFILFNLLNIIGPIFITYESWKKGNKEAFGHFIGFSITLVLVILEIIMAIKYNDTTPTGIVFWGVLFGVISQGFALERMLFTERQKALLYKEDLLKAEKTLKESQLKTLQTKMNPHYLFNSLNTIHALHKIKPELIGDAIMSLANNYRFISDRTDRDWIPFEEEWSFLEDYLHLQKLRFYDTIQIDFKKSGDFSNVVLPPLLLQPIIENSFKHGFRGSSEGQLQLFIHAKMIKDSVFSFVVYDNGTGIPEDLISDKQKLMSRSLGNIKERLKNLYSEFQFDITRNYPEGTRTEIEIILTSKVLPTT